MSIGEAKRLSQANGGQKVLIVGRDGRPIRSDLFADVPFLTRMPLRQPYQRLVNGPGCRSYIAAKTEERWTWKSYRPEPATIVFSYDEKAFAEPFRGCILVEPNVKDIGHANKDWGWANWLKLVELMRAAKVGPIVQCGPGAARRLPLAHRQAVTNTFRQAAAVLSVCKAAVLPEGGLHHAAAAVATPAVVIFGGFIGPDVTGYKQHANLFTGGKTCGMRTNCAHCRQAMNAITPAMVLDNLKGILK